MRTITFIYHQIDFSAWCFLYYFLYLAWLRLGWLPLFVHLILQENSKPILQSTVRVQKPSVCWNIWQDINAKHLWLRSFLKTWPDWRGKMFCCCRQIIVILHDHDSSFIRISFIETTTWVIILLINHSLREYLKKGLSYLQICKKHFSKSIYTSKLHFSTPAIFSSE